MFGFLIPDTYVLVKPGIDDLLVASIIWGFTLATGMFAASKAFKQTRSQWRRSRRVMPYVVMIWAEWFSSQTIGVVSWIFLRGLIEPSFWIYFSLLCLWVVQIQCICGIIINRISLLMVDRRDAVKIRWGTAILLGLINISLFVIWIPAQLQISGTFVNVNHIWDRIEKGLFLVIDACLHLYFIYLIRVKLIANGLEKYNPLFRFNLSMVAISMSLDSILIGSMSIGNGFIYIQFHPLVYMLKLYIEMNISALIFKVVRATGDHSSYQNDYQQGTELQSKPLGNKSTTGGVAAASGQMLSSSNQAHIEAERREMNSNPRSKGITKIVQTHVTVTSRHREEEDDGGSQSSTRQLKRSTHMYHDQFA
ncbi:Fc.00g105740.m01.CDS01 [Cosmosporella sp. VM-42]